MGQPRHQFTSPVRRILGVVVVVWALAMVAITFAASDWLIDLERSAACILVFAGISWIVGRSAMAVVFWPGEHRKAVARRKIRTGRCPRCDYDLRVATDRCPECGWDRPIAADVYAERLREMTGD